jgi:H+/gluconate symporter-like permease
MKKVALAITGVAVLFAMACMAAGSLRAQGKASRTFTGEIMDSTCAKNNNHNAMKDMPSMGGTAPSCTLACIEMGGKFVLQDTAKKTTYQLDDQSKFKEFAGQKVTVTGVYDAKTKTIHVEKIEAVAGK